MLTENIQSATIPIVLISKERKKNEKIFESSFGSSHDSYWCCPCILTDGALELYIGIIWLMFVGGIITIVDAAQVDLVNGGSFAWGIMRVVFASAVGWLFFFPLFALGVKLISDDN